MMNHFRLFDAFSITYLALITLLTTRGRHGATWGFSLATKLDVDAGSARVIPRWLNKSQLQQWSRSDDCPVPRNSTSYIAPKSKNSEEIANIVLHKVKNTVSHTGTFTSLRIIAEQFVRQIERVSERSFERISERATERTIKRATERTLERVAERTYERVGERAGERVLEHVGERVLERTGERALERVGERVLDQVGKKALIKRSEKKLIAKSMNKVRRIMLGKSLSRSAIRIGRTLTIALPLVGGLFALYLFQSDVQRVQEERHNQILVPLPNSTKDVPEQRPLNMIAVSALIFFISTGLLDLLDAIVHFWIAYGLFISHFGSSSHHLMERISTCCAISSTLCAIMGEVSSYLYRKGSNSPQVATSS